MYFSRHKRNVMCVSIACDRSWAHRFILSNTKPSTKHFWHITLASVVSARERINGFFFRCHLMRHPSYKRLQKTSLKHTSDYMRKTLSEGWLNSVVGCLFFIHFAKNRQETNFFDILKKFVILIELVQKGALTAYPS